MDLLGLGHEIYSITPSVRGSRSQAACRKLPRGQSSISQ